MFANQKLILYWANQELMRFYNRVNLKPKQDFNIELSLNKNLVLKQANQESVIFYHRANFKPLKAFIQAELLNLNKEFITQSPNQTFSRG